MKCPVDSAELVMSERHGIEIDYCPLCRGVWLDRGELDKILERSAALAPPPPPPMQEAPRGPAPQYDAPRRYDEPSRYDEPPRHEQPRYRDDDDDDDRYRGRSRKRRGSFLDDLFDFD